MEPLGRILGQERFLTSQKPQRLLGLFDITCIGINAIVGSSIFLFPGQLANFLGPASFLSFGLVGVLLINVGLCFAEASTYFDQTGGPYLYAREAFGDWVGFGIGWMCWISIMFSWAAVANAIAVYLGFFGTAFSGVWLIKTVAAAVIITMGAINYRGVKLGAWTSDFFTAAKLIPLVLFVILGLPHIHLPNYAPFSPHGWHPMGSACFLVYFAFQGFEYIPVPSGEVDRPSKNVPLALILALLISAALYMAIQAVAVGVYPELAHSQRPLADAALQVLGPAGAGLMVLGAVLSTTGYNSGIAFVAPRYIEALSYDRHLPSGLADIHTAYGTPHRAVILTTAITLTMALLFDFNKLVDFTNVVVCAQYLATCAAIPLLRRTRSAPKGTFRLPGGMMIPIMGFLATLWLGAQGAINQIWWSIAILFFGFLLKAGWHKFGRN